MGVYDGRFQSQNPLESKTSHCTTGDNPLSKGGKRSEDVGLSGHQSRYRFIQVMGRTGSTVRCSCMLSML